MLLIEREQRILNFIQQHTVASVRELAELCDVTEVTIRRDLKRLESLNLLQRTHGGAVRIGEILPAAAESNGDMSPTPDALILAPLQNRAVHTLRERALRNQIPLLAESMPQDGAIYLGANNYEAALDLGRWTGMYIQQYLGGQATVLDITQLELSNTCDRSAGFSDGLREIVGAGVPVITVNGRALYSDAYQVAADALRLHPEINIIFGINDDCVFAGIQAYQDLGYDMERLAAVNVGGEGRTIFNALQHGRILKACLALFPEAVGRVGVDTVLRLWAGEDVGDAVITPAALLTPDNLTRYYTPTGDDWELNLDAIRQHLPPEWTAPAPDNKRISFVIHYRTHEWYQNIARAMQRRAAEVGVEFGIEDVHEDLKAETRELRRMIGKAAASYVKEGETILLDAGTTTGNMAQFLPGYDQLTVITNSIDVFQRLRPHHNITLILTGGQFDPESGALIGRGAHLLLNDMRVDKVFLVAGGISTSFGLSSVNVAEAEVRRSMIAAAREVIVLADHTVIGIDAKARVTGLDEIDTLITDPGVPSSQRLEWMQRGIKVIVAGQV